MTGILLRKDSEKTDKRQTKEVEKKKKKKQKGKIYTQETIINQFQSHQVKERIMNRNERNKIARTSTLPYSRVYRSVSIKGVEIVQLSFFQPSNQKKGQPTSERNENRCTLFRGIFFLFFSVIVWGR